MCSYSNCEGTEQSLLTYSLGNFFKNIGGRYLKLLYTLFSDIIKALTFL